jgi:hypothetical protein
MRDAILTVNEKEFILKARCRCCSLRCCDAAQAADAPGRAAHAQALLEEQRVDGRRPFDPRPPKFEARRAVRRRCAAVANPRLTRRLCAALRSSTAMALARCSWARRARWRW